MGVLGSASSISSQVNAGVSGCAGGGRRAEMIAVICARIMLIAWTNVFGDDA